MTDTNLGAAAGDIFAKAFTLGYETGRTIIPAGGMALTAEQVEDVRTMLWSPGVTALAAFRRLRARFPATEPAEAHCTVPPEGWWCSRAANHDGPCAASEGVAPWVPQPLEADWLDQVDPRDPQSRTHRETAAAKFAEPAEEETPVHPKPDVGDWGYGGGAAVYAPEVRGKTREELLSEKVEQLQAQVKHLSRVAVNAAEHGIKAPSGSLKPCGYCHSTEATLLHACTNCGAMTSDPWSHPTSAAPAEEETKAEAESDLDMHPDAVYGREYVEQAKVRRIARAVKECDTPSSSPVVPAPTETEAGHA